ncbi:hypothetical protein HDU96_009570 [Phlyctochytrium bullatum]|nr:hypothetical protein HDU96_009570 [Phlyctochytrium bullatum]
MAASYLASYFNHLSVPHTLAATATASVDPSLTAAMLGPRTQSIRQQPPPPVNALPPMDGVWFSTAATTTAAPAPQRPSHLLAHAEHIHSQQQRLHSKLKAYQQPQVVSHPPSAAAVAARTSCPPQPSLPPNAYNPHRAAAAAHQAFHATVPTSAPQHHHHHPPSTHHASLVPSSSVVSSTGAGAGAGHPHSVLSSSSVASAPAPVKRSPASRPPSAASFASGTGFELSQADYDSFEAYEDVMDSSEHDEYGCEIIQFMRSMENMTLPDPHYMETQPDLSWKLRKTLIVWLVEIHSEYDLKPETLYLAVNFIDRVCAKRHVPKIQYQLLGITALWVAAKYEENHGRVPTLKNLIYICCNSYTEKDYVDMEQSLLADIDFKLGHPTAEAFLKAHFRYFKGVPAETRALARYIMEGTLVHRRFIAYRPSTIAVASLVAAEMVGGRKVASPPEASLIKCLGDLFESFRNPPKQIVNKYGQPRFLRASYLLRGWLEMK